MLLFLVQLINYQKVRTYVGNWTGFGLTKHGSMIKDDGKFIMSFTEPRKISNYYAMEVYTTYRNGKQIIFNIINSTFGAIYDQTNQTGFLFFSNLDKTPSIDQYVGLVDFVCQVDKLDPYNFTGIAYALKRHFAKQPTQISFLPFVFHFENYSNLTGPFDLSSSVFGNYILPTFNFSFVGSEFNMHNYNIEGKSALVLFCATILCTFYAWLSITHSYKTESKIRQLSSISIILNTGIDFGVGLLYLEIGVSSITLLAPYALMFIAQMLIYFTLQIKFLSYFWKYSIENGDILQLRHDFMFFFFKATILMSVTSFATLLSLELPYACLPILSIAFLPQVIHNVRFPTQRRKDTLFIILLTIARILPLSYFTLYPNNIGEKYSVICVEIFGGIIIFITVLLLIQRYVSPTFGLSSSENYYSVTESVVGEQCPICLVPIESINEATTTPCGHSFHKECLDRWMDERPVCPMCRSDLPPIAED